MDVDVETLVGAGPVAQVQAMDDGVVTSRQLTIATLAAVEREDARLNAVVEILTDEAFDAAAEADERRARGERSPLLGVPTAIKNDADVAGHVTGLGSRAMWTPTPHDGELVSALRRAGAVPMATTTLPELAIFGFTESLAHGITRNPHHLDHTPGGSSGGSAALVAAGAVGVATASDGAGSVRIPAACCGLVGFKPTHGTMPGSGGWYGLSTQGALARKVVDAALYLDALGTFSTSLVEASAEEPSPLRIGVTTSASAALRADRLDPPVKAALAHAADLLAGHGHEVRPVKVPYGRDAKALTVRYLAGIRAKGELVEDPTLLESRTRRIMRLGRPFGPRSIERARAAGERWGDRVLDDLGVDVLLSPVMSSAALEVGSFSRRGGLRTLLSMNAFYPYTAQWNHAGLPAVSMPMGADGPLPLAVQLVGRRHDDATLISLAAQLEQE
ncbi:amidase family protein [Aeromicrobium sp. CTD01-1L150]|uniref:amidase family protein n=1 Tax=Aeromicrobium sp. CTD01-1L150 TaxID=3341830 RepID=UPI0035C0A1C5